MEKKQAICSCQASPGAGPQEAAQHAWYRHALSKQATHTPYRSKAIIATTTWVGYSLVE